MGLYVDLIMGRFMSETSNTYNLCFQKVGLFFYNKNLCNIIDTVQ